MISAFPPGPPSSVYVSCCSLAIGSGLLLSVMGFMSWWKSFNTPESVGFAYYETSSGIRGTVNKMNRPLESISCYLRYDISCFFVGLRSLR